MGIEPTSEAWEASILPLYDARSESNPNAEYHWRCAARKNAERVGRAYSHRIPLAKLKCISPKRWEELAARRKGEEPGGAARVKSGRHDYPRSLFRSGA